MMESKRLRILFVTASCPGGPAFGGLLRTMGIGGLLKNFGDVTVVLVPRKAPDNEAVDRARKEFPSLVVLPLSPRGVKGVRERISHELSSRHINSHGWVLDADSQEKLKGMINDSDVTWIHGLPTANNTGISHWPKTVLDIDDIPSQFHRSKMKSADGWIAKLRAWRSLFIWRRREVFLRERFPALVVCSDADREYFGGNDQVHVTPNGYGDGKIAKVRNSASPPRIGFIGTLNYPPNADGVQWFINHVWPKIKEKQPDARFRLVGADSEGRMQAQGEDVDRLGFVDDAAEEIGSWCASIVPLRIGGGTRIKIAEAFGRMCPVVSTRLGAFGYEVTSGEELLLADEPQEFADACLFLINNPEQAERMAQKAADQYLAKWTWPAIGSNVERALEYCMKTSDVADRENV